MNIIMSSIKSQVLDLKTLPIFSPLKRGVIYEPKTIFIPVPSGVMTQDERNCDHKTGKTST